MPTHVWVNIVKLDIMLIDIYNWLLNWEMLRERPLHRKTFVTWTMHLISVTSEFNLLLVC